MRTPKWLSISGAIARSMAQAVSSSGSSTFTTWKRRASAASFSKYFLYSPQVVAAIVRSSPRASAGLSRLAASFWLLHLHDLEAPRQRRLEQVGGIVLAGLAAGTDHRVRLVDEQDDRVQALLDLLDHVLEAVLELALDAGAGLQQAHVERVDLDALQYVRHVALRDAQRQPFGHRRLADARLAGQDRVVLTAPHQDVDHLAYFGIASDHRIDLAVARAARQARRVLIQCRRLAGCGLLQCSHRIAARSCLGTVGTRRRRGGNGLVGTFGQALEVMFQPLQRKGGELARCALRELGQPRFGEQRQQQVPAADALLAARAGTQRCDQPGMFEQLRQAAREHGRARAAAGQALDFAAQIRFQARQADPGLARCRDQIGTRLFQQGQEQMFDVDFVLSEADADGGRARGGRAGRVVQLADQGFQVDVHRCSPADG
jgi:hypothetical protein